MSRRHIASLQALNAFGPRSCTLADFDRRAPTSSYAFACKAGTKNLLYIYSRDDDGSIAGADFIPAIDFAPIASPAPVPGKPGP